MSAPTTSLKPAVQGAEMLEEVREQIKKQDSLNGSAKMDWVSGATWWFRIVSVEPHGNGQAKLNLE